MPKLKKKIEQDFTTIHNKMVRDKNLNMNARGLLLTMLSLPDDWNFSIRGLTSILPDGVTKISSTLKDLEKQGYLIRKRVYCNGKISDWEYIFSDEPMNATEDVSDEEGKNLDTENLNQGAISHLDTENLNQGFLNQGNQHQGNQHQENPNVYKINNNKRLNNQILNNQSINQSKETDGQIDINENQLDLFSAEFKAEQLKQQIRENIEYDHYMTENYPDYVKTYITEIYKIICDVMCIPHKSFKINKAEYPCEVVRNAFLQLTPSHIEYVRDQMSKNTTKITNMRGYLIAALYNAVMTIDHHYEAEVRSDMYGYGGVESV